jgi:hypothetical protein
MVHMATADPVLVKFRAAVDATYGARDLLSQGHGVRGAAEKRNVHYSMISRKR